MTGLGLAFIEISTFGLRYGQGMMGADLYRDLC